MFNFIKTFETLIRVYLLLIFFDMLSRYIETVMKMIMRIMMVMMMVMAMMTMMMVMMRIMMILMRMMMMMVMTMMTMMVVMMVTMMMMVMIVTMAWMKTVLITNYQLTVGSPTGNLLQPCCFASNNHMVHQVPTFPSQTLTSKCFLVSHYSIRLRPLPCQLFRILRGLLTSTMQLQDHQHQGDVLTEDSLCPPTNTVASMSFSFSEWPDPHPARLECAMEFS